MYMHMLARFCESRRCFSLLLSLKYITYSFFSVCSLFPPCCRVSSLLPSSTTPQARGHPRPSLLPPCLPSACPPLLLPAVCAVAAVCLLLSPRPRALFRPLCARPCSSTGGLLCVLSCVVLLVRHSSAVRRKTVWQCGQMHRVYVPGLVSSCLCAAVCSVACFVARSVASVRPSARVCVSCCRVSSGGSNRRYASISRAAAMRCSVWSVMLLLSMAVYTVCRCIPIRLDSSTMPIPAAFMCSRM